MKQNLKRRKKREPIINHVQSLTVSHSTKPAFSSIKVLKTPTNIILTK